MARSAIKLTRDQREAIYQAVRTHLVGLSDVFTLLELVAEGVVTDISHEGLRALLREEGVSFQAVRTWKRSNRTSSPRRTASWSYMSLPTPARQQ